MPIGRIAALVVLSCSLAACSGKVEHGVPVVVPAVPRPPVAGPTALITQAAATYITPSARVADEHVGTNDAAAAISYEGFTARGRFEAASAATADFGWLATRVRASATDATFPVNTALAEASFTDTLVVDHPEAAFLVLTLNARIEAVGLQPGGSHSHGAADVASHLFFRHEGGNDAELGGDPLRPGEVSVPRVPIRPGRPLTYSVVLSTIASIPLNYTATVSATTSVGLRSVTVVDAAGRAMPDATARSASGWTKSAVREP